MPLVKIPEPTFDNLFDLVDEDIEQLEINENYTKDKCLIKNKNNSNLYYTGFILDKNSKTKILCMVTFYRSSKTSKYLPRLTFKKIDLKNNDREIQSTKPIIIAFSKF